MTGHGADRQFLSRTATLGMGAAVGQLAPFLLLPLLTRQYPPADFGELALFSSLLNLAAPLACLKYDLAVVAHPQEEAAGLLLQSSLLLPMLLAAALLPIVPLAGWWPPAALLLTGWYAAGSAGCLRLGRVRLLAAATACKCCLGSLFPLLLQVKSGLVWGQLVGWAVGSALLAAGAAPLWRGKLRWDRLWAVLQRERNYPATLLLGAVSVGAVLSLANYGVEWLYTPEELALFSMGMRLTAVPIGLLSAPAGQVYLQAASDEWAKTGQIPAFFRLLRLFLPVAAVGYGMLAWGADLVGTLLGPGWEDLPFVLRILTPMAALRFAVGPISFTLVVLGQNQRLMVWQCTLLVLGSLSLVLSAIGRIPFRGFLVCFSLLLGAGYLMLLALCVHLLPKEDPYESAHRQNT